MNLGNKSFVKKKTVADFNSVFCDRCMCAVVHIRLKCFLGYKISLDITRVNLGNIKVILCLVEVGNRFQ